MSDELGSVPFSIKVLNIMAPVLGHGLVNDLKEYADAFQRGDVKRCREIAARGEPAQQLVEILEGERPMSEHRSDVLTIEKMAENLLSCIRDNSTEDAFRWCMDIAQRLHNNSLQELTKIDLALKGLRRAER